MSTGMGNGIENGDEMENENGDEDGGEDGDVDGDGDRADLGQECTQLAAISPWWDDPCQDTAPGPPGLVGTPGPTQSCKLSSSDHPCTTNSHWGCIRGLHGVENINCGFLVHFLII